MLIRILLVEDDLSVANQVKAMLSEPDYDVIATCRDKQSVRRVFATTMPDLLITDLHLLERLDGYEVGAFAESNNIPVIFITQFTDDDIYKKTQQIKNSTFLIKPFHKLTLKSQINVLMNKLSTPNNVIEKKPTLFSLYNRSWHDVVFLRDIYWLEANGNYSIIQTKDKRYSSKKSLVLLEKMFPTNSFIRISRFYFVNFDYISKIDMEQQCIFIGEYKLALGRQYVKPLKDKLNAF